MADSHKYHSQKRGDNGDNGRNGGDNFSKPQPSTSGEEAEQPAPSLQSVCFRGLFLCRVVLTYLVLRFSARALGYQTPDGVRYALADARQAVGWASIAAFRLQPRWWYQQVPVRLLQMVTSTGVDLIERYLDIQLPRNQDDINYLRGLGDGSTAPGEEASPRPGSDVDPQPSSYPDMGPVPSPISPMLSTSVDEEHPSEEAPAQPDPPGDRSMNFSVLQLKEQQEETEAVVKDDKQEKTEEAEEKSEETVEEGKAERPSTAVEEAGGAAASTEQPQPQPQPEPQPQPQPPAAAPAEGLVSAQEAEQAAMGAPRTPPAQPASSQEFLAAERPSQPTPGRSRPARRPVMGVRFLELFGSKKD